VDKYTLTLTTSAKAAYAMLVKLTQTEEHFTNVPSLVVEAMKRYYFCGTEERAHYNKQFQM